MDTLSTAIGGALLAKALPEEQRGPSGVWAATLAAVVPDVDVFADFLTGDPLADLTVHRGFTHSLVGVVVMAPLVALAVWRFGKDRNYWRLLALATLGFLWHLFTDLATSWGTMVFYPVSRQRVVWDLLFIIDFIFTAILLLPQLLAWTYQERSKALGRGTALWAVLSAFAALLISLASPLFGAGFNWRLLALFSGALAALFAAPALGGWGFRQRGAFYCRLGVALLTLYFALVTMTHFFALATVKEFAGGQRLRVVAVAALPQPLSPWRWSGLVLTPEGVYQSWFSVPALNPPHFQFFPGATGNEFVARAAALPEVQTYLWFARFPVVRYRVEGGLHIVEYTDRRFNALRNRPTPFVFRVVFNERGVVLARGFEQP